MKRSDLMTTDRYSAPECLVLRFEVEATILTSSPVTCENNIKDPTWNTEGDFGLE